MLSCQTAIYSYKISLFASCQDLNEKVDTTVTYSKYEATAGGKLS